MLAQALAASATPTPVRVLEDGRILRLERDPHPGIIAHITLQTTDGHTWRPYTLYAPADTPPPGYPADLPFVAGLQVTLAGEDRGSRQLIWLFPADTLESLGEALVRRSEEDGWKPEEIHEHGDVLRRYVLARDGRFRTILVAWSIAAVELIETDG